MREDEQILVSHDTAKDVACKSRSEPEFHYHSVPKLYHRHQEPRNTFTRISGHQKYHLIVLAFLLYKGIIVMCTNKLEYENYVTSFSRKGECTN